MARTVIDKVIELVVVLFIVSLGTFALVSLIPGDPSVAVLGEGRAPEEYARVRAEMGLDDPFLTRYWGWLSGALQATWGSRWSRLRVRSPRASAWHCRSASSWL